MKLVTCIGAKTSCALVSHFVEHYRSLGVMDFLVILQGTAGEAGREAVRGRLGDLGIAPVLEIERYSAPRKRAHSAVVVDRHCKHGTWVLHADVDELQVYPTDLETFLAERRRRGHRFVRGRLLDRLAPGGELAEILPTSTIWDQFPIRARVTRRLLGGWDRKVCAADAALPLSDGGAHGVDYGFDVLWNYRLTHAFPRWRDRRVEIHHFKWDASLLARVRAKLEGDAGDDDAVEGAEFMEEYRRLDRHLRRHGRILLREVGPDGAVVDSRS